MAIDNSSETIRRALLPIVNAQPHDTRAEMEATHGTVWNPEELSRDFEVLGFLAPFVVVKRKSDGKKGSLEFTHSPRFYYGFKEA